MNSNIKEILRLFYDGESYEKIGRQFGVTGKTIKTALIKTGIELPKRRKINPKETFNKGKQTTKRKRQEIPIKEKKYCQFCGKELVGRQEKFCSIHCKEEQYKKDKKFTKYARQQDKKAIGIKIEYIKKMGGCCSICGYKKNISALVFHHVDPSMKKFEINARDMVRRSKSDIENEISKCVILCQNCHNEIHHPDLDGLL